MRLIRKSAVIFLGILFFAGCAELQQIAMGDRPLTNDEVIRGLTEALEVGAVRAADTASERGGFLDNPDLFIIFPPEARRVERTLRDIGMGALVDDFLQNLNRAAEDAASSAAPVFRSAISQMTIQDGFEILRGPEDAATEYLRRTTSDELRALFAPVISQALEDELATRYWSDITETYNQIPFVQPVDTDLTSYTTTRALDGLFTLLAEEERQIRRDPVKRTTDILRRVFGHPDAQHGS